MVQGLFETAERLDGVGVRPNAVLRRWHPDVRAYDIIDEHGDLLASFYADFFPRESKRDGAWMNALISGTTKPGASRVHLGLICCNVTPPVGNRQALLSHQEVETLFHEFGHLLHHCLNRVEVRHLVGTNVAWDFVELPSQIMENWCWEREALDLFARHHETGAPVPDDLLQRMRAARTFRAGAATMRQLGFAEIDLALHVDWTGERGDVVEFAREVLGRYSGCTVSSVCPPISPVRRCRATIRYIRRPLPVPAASMSRIRCRSKISSS